MNKLEIVAIAVWLLLGAVYTLSDRTFRRDVADALWTALFMLISVIAWPVLLATHVSLWRRRRS